jgi:hypothetical protein
MSIATTTPTNTNFLSPLGFRFQIKKTPHVNYFVQEVNLPAMALGVTSIPSPFIKIPVPGDHLQFGDLDITFRVDEDMKNYLEIYNWMIAIGKPNDFDQYAAIYNKDQGAGEGIYSDLTLTVLSSAMNPTYEITFVDAYPTSISGLQFSSEMSDIEYLRSTVSFQYRIFNITAL